MKKKPDEPKVVHVEIAAPEFTEQEMIDAAVDGVRAALEPPTPQITVGAVDVQRGGYVIDATNLSEPDRAALRAALPRRTFTPDPAEPAAADAITTDTEGNTP